MNILAATPEPKPVLVRRKVLTPRWLKKHVSMVFSGAWKRSTGLPSLLIVFYNSHDIWSFTSLLSIMHVVLERILSLIDPVSDQRRNSVSEYLHNITSIYHIILSWLQPAGLWKWFAFMGHFSVDLCGANIVVCGRTWRAQLIFHWDTVIRRGMTWTGYKLGRSNIHLSGRRYLHRTLPDRSLRSFLREGGSETYNGICAEG